MVSKIYKLSRQGLIKGYKKYSVRQKDEDVNGDREKGLKKAIRKNGAPRHSPLRVLESRFYMIF